MFGKEWSWSMTENIEKTTENKERTEDTQAKSSKSMNGKNGKIRREKKKRFRLDIALIIAFFILLASFSAYMINTTLEDVLTEEYGAPIVTHDYTYESSNS